MIKIVKGMSFRSKHLFSKRKEERETERERERERQKEIDYKIIIRHSK